jgi:CDP-glucose 4,6-dehydratase
VAAAVSGKWYKCRIVCGLGVSVEKKLETAATRPWQHVLEPLSGYLVMLLELWNGGEFNGESYNLDQSFKIATVMEL